MSHMLYLAWKVLCHRKSGGKSRVVFLDALEIGADKLNKASSICFMLC